MWVANNKAIPKEAKPFCLLPSQTIEGIKICGKNKQIQSFTITYEL